MLKAINLHFWKHSFPSRRNDKRKSMPKMLPLSDSVEQQKTNFFKVAKTKRYHKEMIIS